MFKLLFCLLCCTAESETVGKNTSSDGCLKKKSEGAFFSPHHFDSTNILQYRYMRTCDLPSAPARRRWQQRTRGADRYPSWISSQRQQEMARSHASFDVDTHPLRCGGVEWLSVKGCYMVSEATYGRDLTPAGKSENKFTPYDVIAVVERVVVPLCRR